MKKVLVILVLIAVSGFVGWQIARMGGTTVSSNAISVTVNPQQQPTFGSVTVSASAPVVPMSEVDQKLHDLGFALSANFHKISVAN